MSGRLDDCFKDDEDKRFCTLVFEYDITKHDKNPFHEDTPFGKPCGMSIGNLMEENAEMAEMIANWKDAPKS